MLALPFLICCLRFTRYTSEMFSCHGDTCTFLEHQVTVLGSQLPWKQIFVLAYIVARVNAGLKLKQQSSCSKMSVLWGIVQWSTPKLDEQTSKTKCSGCFNKLTARGQWKGKGKGGKKEGNGKFWQNWINRKHSRRILNLEHSANALSWFLPFLSTIYVHCHKPCHVFTHKNTCTENMPTRIPARKTRIAHTRIYTLTHAFIQWHTHLYIDTRHPGMESRLCLQTSMLGFIGLMLGCIGLMQGCIGLMLGCIGLMLGCIGLMPGCIGLMPGCIGLMLGCTGLMLGCIGLMLGCTGLMLGCIGLMLDCIGLR